uniref:Poly(A) RNA polymerase gld-2-like protein A n=1 Tax=Acartia pacifica TaxID=335913 RepID=A0A0U2V5Z9_ACAPC|nr:poly(A) RNA polymerase gld-2-like protein A [Acartia pacifica]
MKRNLSKTDALDVIDLTLDDEDDVNGGRSVVARLPTKRPRTDDTPSPPGNSDKGANLLPQSSSRTHGNHFGPAGFGRGSSRATATRFGRGRHSFNNRDSDLKSGKRKRPSSPTDEAQGRPGSGFQAGAASSRSEFSFAEDVFPSPDVFSHPSSQFRRARIPDPEHFRIVAGYLAQQIPDSIIHTERKYEKLTLSVVHEFRRGQQTLPTMMQKIDLWNEIYRVVSLEFDCGLFIFGSTFNGFGGAGCDVDMCLFIDGAQFHPPRQKLDIVRNLLRKHCSNFIRDGIQMVPAKVPILKFRDSVGNFEVDLSVDNPTSIRNTHLLFNYAKLDYRVRPLVVAVKMWAKKHNINEARFQTLSSYALTLMVINYLQCGVKPKVLPSLQDLHTPTFNHESDIFRLDYTFATSFPSENTQSTGSLLAGFFRHYARNFDPDRDVASVRLGKLLSIRECEDYARRAKKSPGQWRARLCLEEPFDRTNAARAVCSDEQFRRICYHFKKTSDFLERNKFTNITIRDL